MRTAIHSKLMLILGVVLVVSAFGAASASAETLKSWWHVTASAVPSTLPAEGTGEVRLTFENLGDTQVDGAIAPVRLQASLPAGFKALGISALAGLAGDEGDAGRRGLLVCPTAKELSEGASLACTFPGTLPPFDQIEVTIPVQLLAGAETGAVVQASVSGGGAAPQSVSRPLRVAPAGVEAAVPFGLQYSDLAFEEDGGGPDRAAGSHPFQVTGTFALNQVSQLDISTGGEEEMEPASVALPKNIEFKLPPGLIGNATALPRCTIGQFLTNAGGDREEDDCAADTAIGVANVLVNEPIGGLKGFSVPVFNIEPGFGEPARFGFYIGITETPVLLDASVRSGPGEDYGVTLASRDTSQIAGLLSSQVTFWGVPGEPAHDSSRGWGCLRGTRYTGEGACGGGGEPHPPAFLIAPTSCTGQPLPAHVVLESWAEPSKPVTAATEPSPEPLEGCNQLSFAPAFQAEPTTTSASSASGLNVNLDFHDEGLTSAEGTAESQLNKAVVVLPRGFTIDPSAGVGLAGCTPADYERETIESEPGAGCPNESKLGTVEVQTPLLPANQALHGNVFLAQPYDNPFPEPEQGHPGGTLIALYIVLKNPETGVIIKLAGKVTPNLVTGQLTTTFEDEPPLAFSHFNFHFREGNQAPLITPPTCGTFTTDALLSPWSEPLSALTDTSSFTITSGSGAGAGGVGCPSGAPPFNPGIEAGTVNNNAGAFSPLYIHLTRSDADQEIAGFTTNMPPGLSGYLTGLPFCANAEIEAVRKVTGAQAEAHPICPASEVGHTLVGTGVGSVLAYVPGKLYWAGPFDGAPFSLVSVTSAVVGPVDLGTVVLRFGLNIDPYTAQVNVSPTSSEPIPAIIKGIVTHVRDIRVYVDRPNFIINPTSCNPMSVSSTLSANEGASKTVSSHFQTTNCANLKFAPQISVSTQAKTSKAEGASLSYKVSYGRAGISLPQGTYADIHYVKVELPKQLPSRLTTLQRACTAKQFEANPAGCPPESAIGTAKAIVPNIPEPLSGPVYFVSHGGEAFPSLEIVLQGYGVKVILVGATFISKAGVTSTTFKTVPDNPVTSFELTFPEKPYSALAANGNLCALTTTKTVKKKVTIKVHGKQKTVTKTVKQQVSTGLQMPNEYIAQNGLTYNTTIPIKVTGCPKTKAANAKNSKKSKGKRKAGKRK